MSVPLQDYHKQYIMQLLALGNTKKQIIEKLKKKYGRTINPITITRMKKRPEVINNVNDAQDALTSRGELLGPALLKQKAYKLIDKKLDRALKDDSEIEKLRAQLQTGEIDRAKFDIECTRYEVLTVNELTKIAEVTHQHARKDGDENPLTPQDQAAFALLMQGIKHGNPMQLIQVLNPSAVPSAPNEESPAPPAGIPSQP